jgi:hypothetical protein
MRIIGLVLLITITLIAMGDPRLFVDIPSFILVLGFPIAALLFAGAGIGNMFGASFSADATREQLERAARDWGQACTYAVVSGVIGTFIGGIIILANLDDIGAIGPGAALGILTILHGLILGYGVCLPMQKRLEDRAREAA